MDPQEPTGGDAPDDLQLTVEQGDGETVVTARLDKPAAYCYRLFCRVEDVPGWLMVVGNAVVRRRDAQGRPLEVAFMGHLERAAVGYVLQYTYDDERLEVRWQRPGEPGAVQALYGSARFREDSEGFCRLRYALRSELSRSMPGWDDRLYRTRPAEAVVLDFCEWADRRWEQEHGRPGEAAQEDGEIPQELRDTLEI